MRYLLVVLLGVLGLLVATDHLVEKSQRQHRHTTATLRQFANLSVDQVQSFQLRPGKTAPTWTYVRRDSIWRYPDYFDAFVESGRVDQFLGSLLQSAGTVVGTDPTAPAHFGLQPEEAIEVILQSPSGALLLKALIGRGAPGRGAGEAYVKKAGNDTLLHLHANPRRALGGGDPPMLDRRVLPAALKRKPLAQIAFEHSSGLRNLRRIETAAGAPPLPGRPPQGPTYAWLATFANEEHTCLNASAFAYTSFLTRLRFEELRDPRTTEAFESITGRLQMVDEDGIVDVLEVGSRNDQGHIYLRHRSSGQVLTITAAKAALLFPARSALLDTLPQPSPYQLAEPFGSSPF
jgi:hypothetical protein